MQWYNSVPTLREEERCVCIWLQSRQPKTALNEFIILKTAAVARVDG